MKLPSRFDGQGCSIVYRLKKSLYGLKQSPRAWFERFSKVLISEGYTQGQSDDTMFFKHKNGKRTILIVYVGDIVLTGDDLEEIGKIKHALVEEFEVKDQGK